MESVNCRQQAGQGCSVPKLSQLQTSSRELEHANLGAALVAVQATSSQLVYREPCYEGFGTGFGWAQQPGGSPCFRLASIGCWW
eukprot:scaffold153292_cov17-Tisochrysis_lutea.AAC.1